MKNEPVRHTVHLPDGGRVEVFGDRYEVHLAKPVVVHRKHWICSYTAREEVWRTYSPILGSNPVANALEVAFRTVNQVIYKDRSDD